MPWFRKSSATKFQFLQNFLAKTTQTTATTSTKLKSFGRSKLSPMKGHRRSWRATSNSWKAATSRPTRIPSTSASNILMPQRKWTNPKFEPTMVTTTTTAIFFKATVANWVDQLFCKLSDALLTIFFRVNRTLQSSCRYSCEIFSLWKSKTAKLELIKNFWRSLVVNFFLFSFANYWKLVSLLNILKS